MAKVKSKLTHLSPSGKKKAAFKLAAQYRQRGYTQSQALKKAWSDLRKLGFLD